MFFKHVLLVTALAYLSSNYCVSAATKNVICYWGTWSHYRTGNGQFNTLSIDPNLCTHLIYTFFGLQATDGSVISLDPWLDIDLQMLKKTNELKKINPNLKTILAIGGWNEGSPKYSNMAASATQRATFISSALKWVQDYGFDGFDLDWEYPARRGGVAADKENFSKLLKEMYQVFNSKGLLLTAAVSAVPSQSDLSYDVPVLSSHLDMIHVMLYDYFGAWDTTTGFNAPFKTSTRYANTEYSDWNVVDCIQGWISRGANPQKLALGVPFYGRTFTLSSSSNNGVGAAASGAGLAGPYTQTAGFLGYHEIIEKFNAGGWTKGWDSEAQVPYAYNGNQWISYDNPESLAVKVAYAQSLNLGGIMVWSIETEDFRGLSGTKYPLLKAINNQLGIGSYETSSSPDPSTSSSTEHSTSSSTEDSTSSSTEHSSSSHSSTSGSCNLDHSSSDGLSKPTVRTTKKSSGNSTPSSSTFVCTEEGTFRCASDCTKYYVCDKDKRLYEMSCGSSLYFDQSAKVCNWPASVAECQ